MGEPNKKHKLRIGRKQFVIVIVSVCLVALIAEAVLLIHTFANKKAESAKNNKAQKTTGDVIWRVKEARVQTGTDVAIFYFEYDEKGREIRRSIHHENYNGKTFDATPREIKYLAGGCALSWYTDFQDSTTEFFTEDPMILSGYELVINYEVDEAGRLTALTTYDSIQNRKWSFDSEGRPTEVQSDNGDKVQYDYDNQGRLVQIKYTYIEQESSPDGSGYGAVSVSGESSITVSKDISYDGDRRIVKTKNVNGEVTGEDEYKGQYWVGSEVIAHNGLTHSVKTIYYPKGNFILTGTEGRDKYLLMGDMPENLFALAYVDYDNDSMDRIVELNKDGQPARRYSAGSKAVIENHYDKNGMLFERVYYNEDGTSYRTYLFEFDEYGNLTRYANEDELIDIHYEWMKIEPAK
ncbi:MAG: RHS repeat protein [Paludibacteraceae bacterium]|nr:RHS repeat protein [Paludibacteraceae bacterium]